MVENDEILDNIEDSELDNNNNEQSKNASKNNITYISGMYENWFLDYASYVILERAVPYIEDGLKPVQRRILHSMKELEDGRYNKVANIIGNTMKYHPHGDTSIGDALVQLGQKEILIDMQGNWGNIYTGDRAAASRYIEARLSKFAVEVVFNYKTTKWVNSYDGRNKEPETLPVKFPLLLAQGVEGIAVGLASKILPHNFVEIIDASIEYLKGNEPVIYPDFITGGYVDISNYADGLRGGRVKIRAKINIIDKKTLVITDIPFGTSTGSLIDSILSANDKGKIKLRKVEDNTAENVEILIHLQPNISPDKTIDALYAFTDCEISVSPNSCIIINNKPEFIGVTEILKISTNKTVNLLKLELEIRKNELEEEFFFCSLEKIFIENRIYLLIEECETWEAVIEAIDKGLKPFVKNFIRPVTKDDIVKLTEIKIKRISKFDASKADKLLEELTDYIEEVKVHLDNLIDFAINYFKQLRKKYGNGKERKTEIRNFENIEATKVVEQNTKIYANKIEGFIGTSLKNDEFVCECSDIDDILVIREDGTLIVSKVSTKSYVGKNIAYINVFKKNDKRTIYNLAYKDGPNGGIYVKRFFIDGVIRDKEYDLTKGTSGSKIEYLTINPNGEAEIITVFHKLRPRLKKLNFDFNFSTLPIKNKKSNGNILTKLPIRKIIIKEEGKSTLGGCKIWFDTSVKRLNSEGYGDFLGEFFNEDKILSINASGFYRITGYDLTTHFDDDVILIEKFNIKKIVSLVYLNEKQNFYFIKRFNIEISDKKISVLPEEENVKLINVFTDKYPRIEVIYSKKNKKEKENEIINIADFISVKGYKSKGKRISDLIIKNILSLEPIVVEEEEIIEEIEEFDDNFSEEEENINNNKEDKEQNTNSNSSSNSNSNNDLFSRQMKLDLD